MTARCAAAVRALLRSGSGVTTPRCYSSTAGPLLSVTSERLEIRGERWPHTLHLPHAWLRDHCRCPACYDHTTRQRIFLSSNLPPNIQPATSEIKNDTLHIVWPDGHASQYPLQFLWRHTREGGPRHSRDTRTPWRKLSFPAPHAITIPEKDIFAKGEGVRKLLHSIERYGLAMITEVAPTVEATQAVVEAVFPMQRTFFGDGVWHMHAGQQDHSDTAYTSQGLSAHTDGTYLHNTARLQVFHMTRAAPEGGDTLLVDGLHVAARLRDTAPEAYAFLCDTYLPAEYIEEGRHQRALYKTFDLDPATGRLRKFSYNPYDLAPHSTLGLGRVAAFYEHYGRLSAVVADQGSETWLKLQPGTVLLVDNWRVMHGRAAYRGRRSLAGCYVAQDDYTSALATLLPQ